MTDDWYAYPTNYSNGTIADSPGKLLMKYPAFILNDWLGLAVIGLIFAFTFIISLASGARKALLTSSFISFIFAVFFVRLDMINPLVILILIIGIIIGALGSKNEPSY